MLALCSAVAPTAWVLDVGHPREGTFALAPEPALVFWKEANGEGGLASLLASSLAFLSLWGPIQPKSLVLNLNLKTNSCLLFVKSPGSKMPFLWGNWSFFPVWWPVGAAPLYITLYEVSIQWTQPPRRGFLPALSALLLHQRKYLRCFQEIRERAIFSSQYHSFGYSFLIIL